MFTERPPLDGKKYDRAKTAIQIYHPNLVENQDRMTISMLQEHNTTGKF
jgi:hypothetical protein